MRTPIIFSLALSGLASASATISGFDISSYQPNVNFAKAKSSGAGFVIIKATEGTSYKSPYFSTQYTGATNAGLIRGGYHFARPGSGSGATQAKYFIANGGGWSGDGRTLPGMLDVEGDCGGLSQSATVSWIKDFSDTYHSSTGRYPMIYTDPSWWSTCTGNSNAFANTNPLVLARYASTPGTLPGGWPQYTIWQFNDHYSEGGDSDIFNGDQAGLRKLATG
ncbi:Uu.00g138020.m01.CDS01 [Anthostomella pinea]|uniref:N,O-diacetylmuramidase n=1 Tax=Anthostomella pinea TaxID=933095 RepID=A0AAI8YIR4_9PEZI|nr:Uu.00g138020.m01.CDS01 [Anthostomella pinea]